MKRKLYIIDDRVVDIDSVKDDIYDNGLTELLVHEAKRELKSYYFYCKISQESGEKGNCGLNCSDYSPRNGKNGICKYNSPVYIKGKEVLIKL
jgi:hypothetical protein